MLLSLWLFTVLLVAVVIATVHPGCQPFQRKFLATNRENASKNSPNPGSSLIPTKPQPQYHNNALRTTQKQSIGNLPQDAKIIGWNHAPGKGVGVISSTEWQQNNFYPGVNLLPGNIPPTRLTVPKHVIMVPYVDDTDLQYISTLLFQSDHNNLLKRTDITFENKESNKIRRITIKDGGKLTSIPTYKALDDILRMYSTKRPRPANENTRLKEKLEEKFLQEIMKTTVIKNLFGFLIHKNIGLTSVFTQRDFLKQIWFTRFDRLKSVNGRNTDQRKSKQTVAHKSCGFEHTFRGEPAVQGFSGMHNWYSMYKYSRNGNLQIAEEHSFPYLDPSTNEVLVELKSWTLTYAGMTKQSSVMFGISPELEIALVTLCFIFRTNKPCILALGDHKMYLRVATWDIGRRDVLVISTFYPTLSKRFNKKNEDMAPLQSRRRSQPYWNLPGQMHRYSYGNEASRIPVHVRG